MTKILPGPYDRLDLNSYIFVGGMIDTSKKNLGIRAPHYKGCLADLEFDGIKLLEGVQEARRNLPRSTPYDIYGDMPFTCQHEDYRPVTFLTPESYVKVTLPKLPQDNDTFSTSFKFRTFYPHGLLFSRSAIKVKMYVRLQAGSLIYDVTAPNGSKSHIKVGSNLHDGEWHHVNATISPPKITLNLDNAIRARILNMTSLLLDYSNKSRMKIFAGRSGASSKFPGFVGCMLNLKVDSHQISLKALNNRKYAHGIDASRCSTRNLCLPDPCQNRGVCTQDWKHFYCNCVTTYFEGKTCQIPVFKPTCEDYKRLGLKRDSHCLLHTGRTKPDDRYTALCNLTNPKRAYTVVKHNLEIGSVKVKNGEKLAGQYVHKVYYQNLNEGQIAALVQHSARCRQFIRFDCINSKLLNSPSGPSHVFWTSLDRDMRYNYWGGSNESGRCACGMSSPSRCANAAKHCNCDVKDKYNWRSDEGYLTTKKHLPVMMVIFNKKTGKSDSSFQLGPLECWGKSDHEPVTTTVDNLIDRACYPVIEPTTPTTTVTTTALSNIIPCPDGTTCYNLTFPTDSTGPIRWTHPTTLTTSTTVENKYFNVQSKETSDEKGIGTTGIVLLSCALVILLLLSLKFILPKVIKCIRTNSKRGEYIVPPSGPPGYPARLMPLVAKRSSIRGRQLTHTEATHLPTEHSNGNLRAGGVNNFWV